MDIMLFVTFGVTLVASIVSGMSGGGGGFIVVPYLLTIGMPPAHALATAKFGGAGTSLGALTAFKGKGYVDQRLVKPLVVITVVCALVSAWLVPRVDPGILERLIGIILVFAVPTLFLDKGKLKPGKRSRGWLTVGYGVYIVFAFIQTMAGTGMGALIMLTLMLLFGLNALQAAATMRVPQAVQAIILCVLLALQGFTVWPHAIAMFLGTTVGTFLGTRLAIKKGHKFVKFMLAVVMAVSGASLLTR